MDQTCPPSEKQGSDGPPMGIDRGNDEVGAENENDGCDMELVVDDDVARREMARELTSTGMSH